MSQARKIRSLIDKTIRNIEEENITPRLQPFINQGTLPEGSYYKGTASGHDANCLIDSTGQGVGVQTTKEERQKIRAGTT